MIDLLFQVTVGAIAVGYAAAMITGQSYQSLQIKWTEGIMGWAGAWALGYFNVLTISSFWRLHTFFRRRPGYVYRIVRDYRL